jgi:hypothetical protein
MLEPYLDVTRNPIFGESLDRGTIAVEPDEQPARPKTVSQGEGIATAPERGVHERLARGGSKTFYYLL